jgi:DNA-binding NarL/FixJ family response regulator
VEQIWVLMGDMPRIMRELVGSAVTDAPDITLVGSADGREAIAASLDRTKAEVLIVGVPDERARAAFEAMLYQRPRLTLLTIGANGRSSALHELRPHTVTLGDVSPAELVEAIRASARAHRGMREC